MPISRETFLERLQGSGLMSLDEVEGLLNRLPQRERPQDGETLARWLVDKGHLTPWQATQIYQGNTNRLILDNYVILGRLGAGGMGQVFKAQHQRMKRVVALKLLPDEMAADPRTVARFQREVQAAARLMHPNIVAAFDADEAAGIHFLVMEYVPGRDLASLVRRFGPLSVHQAIVCVLDAARGLEYAHRHHVTHRDIKPANLLLAAAATSRGTEQHGENLGTVKILDMGVARIDEPSEGTPSQAELTGTGVVIGTVDYMAPEQALETRNADHRSDIYSLGMTLYFLLTGKPAYTGDSAMQRFVSHRESPIPSLRAARKHVPAALDAIFAKMVAKRPQDRYQSMSEVVSALEDVKVRTSDPFPGDVTAVAVTGDADTAMQEFLQVVGEAAAPTEASEPAALAATGAGTQNTQPEAPRPQFVPRAAGTSEPEIPRQPRLWRRWLWPTVVVGVCALILLLPPIERRVERPPDPGTDRPVGSSGGAQKFDQFALNFSGPRARVDVPPLPLDLSQPFSIEAWCRPHRVSEANNVGRFVGQLGPVQLKIWKDQWQSLVVDVATQGSAGVYLEVPFDADSDDRVHVAFQWTGEKPLLFVQGERAPDQLGRFNVQQSAEAFLDQMLVPGAACPLVIGNFAYSEGALDEDSGQFDGTVEAVRVSQGLRYQDAFVPGELSVDDQTIALYPFHEATGTTLHDVSGHGHDGTIIDADWTARDGQ